MTTWHVNKYFFNTLLEIYPPKEVQAIRSSGLKSSSKQHLFAQLWVLLFFFATGVGSLGAQGPPEFFQRAQGHIQEGNLSKATQALEQGLQSTPDFVDGWVLLGQVYLQLGLQQKAVSALSKGFAIKASPRIHLLLAQSYHLQGIYPDAIRHYQAVVELSPDSADSDRARKGLNQIGKTPEEAIEARAHFEKAMGYLKEEKLPEGLEELQALLGILPDHLAGLSLQATILSRQEKIDQAITSLQRAVGVDSSFYRGFFQLAGLYHTGGRLEEAIKNYRRVIQINPRSPEAKAAEKRLLQIGQDPEESGIAEDLISEARAFLEIGLTKRSYVLMVEVLKLVPDNLSANYLMAQIQAGLGQWQDAIKSYQHVIQVEPANYASFFQIGLLFQLKGNFKEAVVHYQAAIFLKEDAPESKEAKRRLRELGGSPEIAQRLEEILEEVEERVGQQDFDGGMILYEEAVRLIPENADNYYQLGLLLKQAERVEEAISVLQSAVELKPRYILAHYTLALILEEEGRISDAILSYAMVANFGKGTDEGEDAKERLELLKGEQGKIMDAKRHINRGNELKKLNDFEGAIHSYLAAVALVPQVANIHLNLGRTYFLRGQMEEAFRSLQKTLELEPNMVQALFTLGLVYQSKGLYLEAIETHQKVLFFGTDEREVELVIEELLESRRKFVDRTESYQFIQTGFKRLEENKPLEAMEVFEKALRLDPLNFSLHFQIGVLYQERSLLGQAISSFQKAIEIKPWYTESHHRLAQLYELQQSYGKAIAEYKIYDALTHQASELDIQQSQEQITRIEALRKNNQRALSDGEAHFDQAKQYIKDEQFDLAKEAIQVAIFFDPENILYHSNLGFIYYAQDLKLQARAAYRRALLLNLEYAPVHHSIGIILEESQLYRAAKESYDLAIKYGLKGPELKNALKGGERVVKIIERQEEAQSYRIQAYELTQQGEDDKALEKYLKANEIEPDATVFLNIGLLYQEIGKVEKAEKAFLDAIEFNSEVRFLVQLTNFYLDEDRLEDAVQALEKTIQEAEEQEKTSLEEAEEAPGLSRVKSRVERAGKRLSASVSHTFLTFDSNRTSSVDNPQVGIRNSFGVSFTYSLKRTRRINFPATFSINNSFGYNTQTYVNSESLNFPLTFQFNEEISLQASYRFRYSMNALGPSSYTHTVSFGGSLRGKWPSQTSLSYSLSKITSFRTRTSDSLTQSVSLSLSQRLARIGGSLGFGYSFGIRTTPFRLEQEAISHSGSLTLTRPILTGLSGNLGYSFSFSDFPNKDILERTRKIIGHSVRSGLSYSVIPGFTLGVNYSYQISKTNLSAVPEDLSDLIEGLVIPLTGFKKHVLSFGASLAF